jgi:hypothetical protein
MKFLILLLLFSCKQNINIVKQPPIITPTKNVANADPLFKPFSYAFQLLYNINVDLPIVMDSTNQLEKKGVAGLCQIYQNGDKKVLVSPSWWNCKQYGLSGNCIITRPDIEKRVLIFHELGHCLLNRDHDYEYNPDGTKVCDSYDSTNNCIAYKYRLDAIGKPLSIMYPIMETINYFYYLSVDYYDYELSNTYPQSWDAYSLNLWNTNYQMHVQNLPQQSNMVESSKCVQYLNN